MASEAQVAAIDFADAQDMVHVQREAHIEYLALKPGAYEAQLTLVDFGVVRIQHCRDQAHITRGTIHSGRYALLFRGETGLGRVNGWNMAPSDAVLFAPGAELHAFVPGEIEWAALAFEMDAFEALLDGAGLPGAGRFSIQAGFIAKTPALRAMAHSIAAAARADPGRFLGDAVRGSVMESLRAAVAQGMDGPAASASTRALGPRVRVIRAADEYMRAALGRPITTEELCAALAVAPRTLHDAFLAVYGVSPHQYLRLRRLHLVRSALKSPAAGRSLVKSVALAHGFWHLGRFAHAYRSQFGEAPSATAKG